MRGTNGDWSQAISALLAAGLVLLTSVAAAASPSVQFEVEDDEGEPVAEAEVTFLELDVVAVTDDEGQLEVDDVFDGEHTLLIDVEGMEPKWAEFEVDGGEPSRRNFVIDGEASTALADDDATPDGQLQLRTTSASPLENPVEYQPVETLDQRELQRRASNSYGEMLDGSPGVAMRSFGSAPARPVIRGLGGERVLVLQNGERTGDVSSTAHDHHISVDPLEADRVEIVRGPASLMYGSSALGGVINIMDERIPRQWAEGPFSEAALYGQTAQPTGAGAASAGYGFENSAIRGRASHRRAGDMQTPDATIPDTGIQGTTADIGAATETDNGHYGMSLGLQDLTFGLPDAIDDADESVELQSRRVFTQARAERELSGFFEDLEWRLLANRYGHDEMEYDLGADGDIIDEELELGYDVWSVSSSLTLRHGEAGVIDRGALGLQIRGRDLQLTGDEVLSPDAREGAVAAYLFEEIPLSEKVRLQFGARPELHVMEARENDDFGAPDDATRVSPTFSASAGIHVEPVEGLEVGAQLARAHRAPIVEELYSDAAHLGTGQYEIGDSDLSNEIGYGGDLFTRWSGDRVGVELSGFVNYIDDFIVLEPTGEIDAESDYPIYQYDGAEARIWGGEIAAQLRPWRDLEFGATVDYVRGHRLSPEVEDLASMPPLRARLEGGWNGDNLWSMARLRASASQTRTAPNEEATDGYGLVDLEGGFRVLDEATGSHNLSVRVDNILDTSYRDHLSRVRGIASPMPGRSLHATYRWVY